MIQKLWIEDVLPSLNEYIAECRRHPKKGSSFKKKWESFVRQMIRKAKLKNVRQARFEFIWIEKNKKRDKDNVSSLGRKIILDALVAEQVLPNDGWRHVVNWADHFYTTDKNERKKPGVMVLIEDMQGKTLEETKQYGPTWSDQIDEIEAQQTTY